MGDLSVIVKGISIAAKTARILKLAKVVSHVRDYAAIGLIRPLHYEVLHRMRLIPVSFEDWDDGPSQAAQLATETCTQLRELMGDFLELRENQLHCCIKVLSSIGDEADPADDVVSTWVRSLPMDNRPAEIGTENAHRVKNNSVWSAFYGVNDGRTNWRKIRCFACNDLTKWNGVFVCDRENWQHYYNSTLVVPIRYPIDKAGLDFAQIGFIAFDSPVANAFRGLPDIFSYRERIAAYDDVLNTSTAFHLAAIYADILGTFLMHVHKNRIKEDLGNE